MQHTHVEDEANMRRLLWGVAVLGVLFGPLADRAHADVKTIKVDCGKGETIAHALAQGDDRKPLVIVVKGTCAENVTIERDDVALQGEPGAAIVGADATRSTIVVDGARRVLIEGLTVSGGGRHGVSAFRNATVDLSDCRLENNAQFGVAASFGSIVIADGCDIQNNGTPAAPPAPTLGGGAVASNGGQLVLTNSTVQNNAGNGVSAVRTGSIRLGQDFLGTATVGPVTVRGNGFSGVTAGDSSTAMIVGGVIENNGQHGVGMTGSTVQIGVGVNGVTSAVTIRNNGAAPNAHGVTVYQGSRALVHLTTIDGHGGDGVRIEGAAATVTASQIRNSGRYGVSVQNSGSARLGIADSGGPASPGNVIELSGLDGVHLVSSSSAWFFGNTIQANDRHGVLAVEQSVARFVGLNTVQGNGNGTQNTSGVFLRDASLHVLKGDFNITPNTNQIINNLGDGIQAIENATVELRDGVDVSGNAQRQVALFHGGRMRAQATTIATPSGNPNPAVMLGQGSTFRVGPNPVTVTGVVVCADTESSLGVISPATPPASSCSGF